MFSVVMGACAGPHGLGPGGARDGEELPEVLVRFDSEPSSDISSGDGDNDGSPFTSIGSESDIVIHNTTSVRLRYALLSTLTRSD